MSGVGKICVLYCVRKRIPLFGLTNWQENIFRMRHLEGMAYINPNGVSTENMVRGGLFHHDLSPKKAALALKELFEKEWHTEMELITDEKGCIDFRGFYGDYIVQIDGEDYCIGIHKGDTENIIQQIQVLNN